MEFEKYFDNQTMSLHLRENSLPTLKKGVPGKWEMVKIKTKLMLREDIKRMSQEILDNITNLDNSFLEINREGSSIIQYGEYRIVITRPPFSDGWEITAVKPVAKLNLDDYKLDEKLKQRLTHKAEGVLIAGSPGEGKTTLARAAAEYYSQISRIVKTVESPRDLLLNEDITQYSVNYGSRDEIYDVLLLSRPDITIFDEMRNADDFRLFADLRLAGIGMVGVIHATNPIDAIQRFIGKIDLGVIPQIIDTVIFVKGGFINKVLWLAIKVKVPSGMSEADLSRPVVEVSDFFTNKLEYEIYTYGEQTVVIAIGEEDKKLPKLIEEGIKEKFRKYTPKLEIEPVSNNKVVIYVPEYTMSKIIGKKGVEIERLERELGLGIDLRELKEKKDLLEIDFEVETRKNLVFYLDKGLVNRDIDLYSGEEFLLSAKSSKKGQVKVNKQSKIGEKVLEAVENGKIRLLMVN